jgi:hypothetical protein
MKNLLFSMIIVGAGYGATDGGATDGGATDGGATDGGATDGGTTGGGTCEEGYVEDCSGDGDCCLETWIGNGFEDCEDQAYDCDLSCYDNDGGDCSGTGDGGTDGGTTGGGQCNESNWQEYYPEMEGCDLYYANLQGANLSDANLSYANLAGADLSYAILEEEDLYDGDFINGPNLCNLAASLSGEVCEESGGITDDNGDGYDDASYSAGAASVAIDSFACAELNQQYNSAGCVDGNAITQADVDATYAAGVASVTPEDGITQDTVDAAVAVAEMESYILGAQSGDINGSGFLNVTDIILYVELILNGE